MADDQLGDPYEILDPAPTLEQLEAYARKSLWRLLDETYPDERSATVLAVADRVLAMRAQAGGTKRF